jgi:hypothetical protein
VLDEYDFTVTSSNEDLAFIRVEGKDLKVEGSGLTSDG